MAATTEQMQQLDDLLWSMLEAGEDPDSLAGHCESTIDSWVHDELVSRAVEAGLRSYETLRQPR